MFLRAHSDNGMTNLLYIPNDRVVLPDNTFREIEPPAASGLRHT